MPSPAHDNISPKGPHCIALHDYISPEEGDLCFKAGAVITLIEKVGEEWRRGELLGATGLFPVSFVQIVEDCGDKETIAAASGATTSTGKTVKESTSQGNL